jgi:hypothetical protein
MDIMAYRPHTGQLHMAGRHRHVIHIQTEEHMGDYSVLPYSSPHVTTGGCGGEESCLEHPVMEIRGYYFNKVRGKI